VDHRRLLLIEAFRGFIQRSYKWEETPFLAVLGDPYERLTRFPFWGKRRGGLGA
jgi:hypothetical protein